MYIFKLGHIAVRSLGVEPYVGSLMLEVECVVLIECRVAEVAIIAEVAVSTLLCKYVSGLRLACHIVEDVASAYNTCASIERELTERCILREGLTLRCAEPYVVALCPVEWNLRRTGCAKCCTCVVCR